MKYLGYIIILVIMVSTNVSAKITPHSNEVNGSYDFYFYTPEKFKSGNDSTARPLIVFLHGASLCGGDLSRVKRYGTIDAIEKGRKIDSYVIAPHNKGGAWKPEKVMKLVQWAKEHYNIDASRIYVLGMSLGGFGTLDFIAAYPDKIAAAAAYCGGSTASGDKLKKLNGMPLWIVHGLADRAILIRESDRVADAIKSVDHNSPRLSYDRVPGMNHGQPARLLYLSQTYDWLLSHSLNDSARCKNPTPVVNDALLRSAYKDLRSTKIRKSKSSRSKTNKKSTRTKKR